MVSLPPRAYRADQSAAPDSLDPTKIGSAKWNKDLTVFLGTVCDALSKLDIDADKLAFFTAPNTASTTTLTSFGRLLIACADSASVRTLVSALNKAGDTMSGNLDMGGTSRVTGLAAPVNPTDAVTKSYADAITALFTGALVFKGAWDASVGTFPGGGTAQTGYFYKVSVAGTVNGVSFSVGDDVYALVNNASQSTYAANWLKVEGSITRSEVEAAVGFTFGALAAASSVTASQISDASANGRSLIQSANYTSMLALLGVENAASHGDVSTSILAAEKFSYTSATLTAPRTWSLPAANTVNAGHVAIIADFALGVTATNTLSIARSGADNIISGAAIVTSVALDTAGMIAYAISDGSTRWFVFRHAPFGSAAGQAVRLDSAGKLPALDASQLTNLPSAVTGLKNLIINGAFRFNQRTYVSGTATAAGVYMHDRWKAGAGGCTYTFTADNSGTTITITAGSLKQIVAPDDVPLTGTYTLSWSGTATGRVASNASPGGAYAASPITVTLNKGQNAQVEFQGGTLTSVQLEIGSSATSFERRPYQVEYMLCQRHYRLGVFDIFGASGGYLGTRIQFLPPMFGTPTITTSGVAGGNVTLPVTIDSIAANGFRVYILAIGSPANADGNWVAEIEL